MKITKHEIGNRIRMLRMQQNRTIADVAESCQFSNSLLSKIENGKIVPSVGTLVKIANTLGATVTAIIETDNITTTVYTPKKKAYESMITTQKGLEIFPFATDRKENKIQPILQIAHKNKVIPRVDSHEGQEFIYILKGSMKFRVGTIEYNLNEGDSIYFDAMEKHEGTPISDTVEYLDIFS